MSSEDEEAGARLEKTERIIVALEALANECETHGLDRVGTFITACVTKCQDEYLAEQRRLYNRRRRKSKMPRTTKH